MSILMILYLVAIGGITLTMAVNALFLFTGLRKINKARYTLATVGYIGYWVSLMAPVIAALQGESGFRIAYLICFIHIGLMVLSAGHHPSLFRTMRHNLSQLHIRKPQVSYSYYSES